MAEPPPVIFEHPEPTVFADLPSPPVGIVYADDHMLVECRNGVTYKVTLDGTVTVHE